MTHPAESQGTYVDYSAREHGPNGSLRHPPDADLYQVLVQLSPDAIVIHAAGRIVFINQAGAEIVGTAIDEVVGRPIMDFVHPLDQVMVAERVKDMLDHGKPGPRAKLRFVRPDGRVVIGETRSVPFLYGEQPAILVSIRDITAQLEAEAERVRLLEERAAERTKREDDQRFLIEIASILNGSLDYNTTLANLAQLSVPYLADACIVDIQEADGSIIPVALAHIDPAQIELAREIRRRYPLDPAGSSGTPAVLRRGEPLLMPVIPADVPRTNARSAEHLELLQALGLRSIIHVPLRSRGQSLGVITFAMTTSSRVYGPADLALAEEVAAQAGMAVDNARLYRDAQEALRLRDEFLTVASHELRTPLTALQLQIQVLQRALGSAPADDPLTQRLSRLSAVAGRQMRRLTHLVNDLLDVSQLAEGRLQLHREWVDLATVTGDIIQRFDMQLQAANCETRVALSPVTGYWDEARIEQALSNILSNALKYAAGTPIEITVDSDEVEARVTIRDAGIGIAPGDINRIFGRYERAVSARHYGGMGLGLHIAREVIEVQGGRLSVESSPGTGSTFTIALPLAAP